MNALAEIFEVKVATIVGYLNLLKKKEGLQKLKLAESEVVKIKMAIAAEGVNYGKID